MSRTQKYIITIVLIGVTYLFIGQIPLDDPVALRQNLSLFPESVDEWSSQPVFTPAEALPSQTDQHVYRKYVSEEGDSLMFYVGYWGKFRHGSQVFSGKHLSPGYMLDAVSHSKVKVNAGGKSILVRNIIFKNNNYRISVIYWYHSDRGVTSDRFRERTRNGIDAILNRKTHVALVKIFSEPYLRAESDQIRSQQKRFAESMFPLLKEYLPFK